MNKSRSLTTIQRGRLLAKALAGSWRPQPPPLDLTPLEFDTVVPLAVAAGVGGLLWRQIRDTGLARLPSAEVLQQVHRHYAMQNALHTRRLASSFTLLRSHGIEPVLAKGWALHNVYPEPGIRPFGDIDLCVRPSQYAPALQLLEDPANPRYEVDLHCGFGKFYDERTEELYERSHTVTLDEVEIRVLKFEDHLRFLCLHLLRHGADRAMWLCDIAAAVDAIPPEATSVDSISAGTESRYFDWALLWGDQEPQAGWVAGAIGLAHEILGARVLGTPLSDYKPPKWLVTTVLNEWGQVWEFPGQVATLIRQPRQLLRELPKHWPNPIEASVSRRASFDDSPRLPYQIGEVVAKTLRLFRTVMSPDAK